MPSPALGYKLRSKAWLPPGGPYPLPSQVLKYIGVNDASAFSIEVGLPKSIWKGKKTLQIEFCLDGGECFYAYLDATEWRKRGDDVYTMRKINLDPGNSSRSVMPKFSRIVTNEENISTEEAQKYFHLGEFKVSLYNVNSRKARIQRSSARFSAAKELDTPASSQSLEPFEPPLAPLEPSSSTIASSIIPEKAIKSRALSHGVVFEDVGVPDQPRAHMSTMPGAGAGGDFGHTKAGRPRKPRRKQWETYYEQIGQGLPLALYLFRYRDRESLYKEEVLERLKPTDPYEGMTADQMRAMLQERDERDEHQAGDRDHDTIKQEEAKGHAVFLPQHKPVLRGVAIDLTEE